MTDPASASGAVARKRAAAKAVPVPRKKTVTSRHEDKLTAILRTAAQLFAEKGYESTSLDTIAEQLGMHKATLYHYVKGKESILYQCLVLSFADLDSVLVEMENRSVPPLQRLRQFARSLAHAQNNDFGRCLVLVGSRPLDVTPDGDIRRFQRRLDTTVRSLVTEGIADGSIKPCHPGMVSAMLFGALNWVPRWYDSAGKFSIDQIVDTFMDMLTEGVATARR